MRIVGTYLYPIDCSLILNVLDNMVELIESNGVRQAVLDLPQLDVNNLVTYEDWRTAHLLLVTITSGYLWSGKPSDVNSCTLKIRFNDLLWQEGRIVK
ncbi:unnamed protein product [Strongylus vulgaris]|uniref:Uncharacterized protein n=1 Tax=Strongylus vulgaris TaxID=40348 RepID=A0A3P7IPN7_STRVU|nr:unnamed protein product [Strongylus vulgaris]